MATSLIGQSLGKYKITQLIGHGGMATVYQGYQADVNRYVAIKVLPPHPGRDVQFTERFRREAQTIARLQHPHILPLYDFGVQDDILYLVMAYVPGGSLNDRIRKGPLAPSEVDRLLHQIGPAMDYAHRQGVIHRDIKPDNILLDSEGYALLADFGIAKMVEADGSGVGTVTGSIIGTPAYMSPEQGQGLPVENRSDIYSLGVVVYEMLTGHQPYTADTPLQVVLKHVSAPPPSLTQAAPNLPPMLDRVMQRALAKSPTDRYASADAFASDFSRALQGQELMRPTAELSEDDRSTMIFGTVPGPVDPVQVAAVAAAPTQASQQTTPFPSATVTPQITMVTTPQPLNTALVVGGVAVIALLVLAVLVLALRDTGTGATTPPTTAPEAAGQVTSAPTDHPISPTQVAVAPTVPTFGSVRFSTADALGDTVSLDVEALTPPPAGERYVAWLINPDGSDILPVGTLRLDGLGNGVLSYTDADGRPLPAIYDQLTISREAGTGETPAGEIIYHAQVPAEVPAALEAILVASPEGIDGASLLDGLKSEAGIGQQHTGLAAGANNQGALHTHAEHTINILMGTLEDYNGDGRGQNPGHGEGVLFFLDQIEAALNTAANAPDASMALQSQVELIRTCTQNTRQRMNQIIQIERGFLEADSVEATRDQAARSTELAGQLMDGDDLNGNEQIEPFEGECGINQIATYGVLVGNMDLVEAEESNE